MCVSAQKPKYETNVALVLLQKALIYSIYSVTSARERHSRFWQFAIITAKVLRMYKHASRCKLFNKCLLDIIPKKIGNNISSTRICAKKLLEYATNAQKQAM